MTEYKLDGTRWRSAYKRDGTRCHRETPATLDEAGETVLANAKAAIAKYDPDGTALKFAFISDLHRSEESIYAESVIDDRPSMRLLSRLCDEVDIDAVFCGGDIVNGRVENTDFIQKNMQDVVDDFNDLVPHTNVYLTCGNHCKRYGTGEKASDYRAPLNTNEFLHNLWDQAQYDGNGVELHYIDSTNYYVDFTKHRVRIIFVNQYDGVDNYPASYAKEFATDANGLTTYGSTVWHSALPTTDKEDWLVGVVYHGADTGAAGDVTIDHFKFTDLKDTLQAYVDGGGKGSLGAFSGHYHSQTAQTILPSLNVVHVGRAYAKSGEVGTANAYCISVFVVDSQTEEFREIRVGRGAQIVNYDAYKHGSNNGLLQNGTWLYPIILTVSNGSRFRCEGTGTPQLNGVNLTNLAKMTATNMNADKVTSDTDNVLFSALAGDVIRSEIVFDDDCSALRQDNQGGVQIAIFSNVIKTTSQSGFFTGGMVFGAANPGASYSHEVTLSEDADFTAIGFKLNKRGTSGILGFELNIYKNGEKLVRSE